MSRRRRAGRVAFRFLLLPALVLFALAAGAAFYLQGKELRYEFFDEQIQSTLQQLIGDAYRIKIGGTGISLVSHTALSVRGDTVEIFDVATGARLAILDTVKVGVSPLSILQGSPSFDRLLIRGGTVAIESLREKAAQPALPGLKPIFAGLGAGLDRTEKTFASGTIREIQLAKLTLTGAGLRPGPAKPLMIDKAGLTREDGNRLKVSASIGTGRTTIDLSADWRPTPSGGRQLTLGLGPIDTREWVQAIDTKERPVRGLGLETEFRVDIRLPFDGALSPQQAYLKLQALPGMLRIGRHGVTKLQEAVLNARIYPAQNRLEMERSQIKAGEVPFTITGEMVPAPKANGIAGPFEFLLRVEDMTGAPAHPSESAIHAQGRVEGILDIEEKRVNLESIEAKIGEDRVDGSVSIVFGERSPAVAGTISSERLTVTAAKQLWPLHIAVRGRKWVRQHTFNGEISNFQARFDIGKGRMSEVADGGGLRPEELALSANFRGVDIELPGDLPPIEDASGKLRLEAPVFELALADGAMKSPVGGEITGLSGSFSINQIFKKPLEGSITLNVDDEFRDLMSVADLKPFQVAKKLAMGPSKLSGRADLHLEASFPLVGAKLEENVRWQLSADLIDIASVLPIFGRQMEKGDLKLEADNKSARVAGNVTLDGVDTRIDITEPILGGPDNMRKLEVEATVTHQDLEEMNLPVATVARGKMDVRIEAVAAKPERYEVDLTEADLALPWINWLKGRGIPARVGFHLKKQGDTTALEDFTLSGDGFRAKGRIAFDQEGLVLADLRDVSLVGDDAFNVKLSRTRGRFQVAVTGKAFDGRAMIDRVIHEQGFNDEKAPVDVTVEANFASLVGFNREVAENTRLVYRTDNGLLSRFELRGALKGSFASIDALREGETTRFEFAADNAGAALAMVDLYRKMGGGRLKARLTRTGNGPFVGTASIRDFVVEDEERLSSIVSAPAENTRQREASGQLQKLDLRRVRFDELRGNIVKSQEALEVSKGRIRNSQIGLTFEGVVFDAENRMNIRGTFLPLFAISRLIGGIPILGDILSNGKDSGLIGITYRIKGPAKNPNLEVNPISVLAPGVFRQFFEFQQ